MQQTIYFRTYGVYAPIFNNRLKYSHVFSRKLGQFGSPKTPWCCPPIDIKFFIGNLLQRCFTARLKYKITINNCNLLI